MTTEERDRLGEVAKSAYLKALDDLPGLTSRKITEVWARTAEVVAAPLLAEIAALRAERHGLYAERHEIDQVLGKALGYPPAYPDLSPVDDGIVVTGEHTVVTLADEAAARLQGDAAAPLAPAAEGFEVGQLVEKIGGDYRFVGPVVARFFKLSGQLRYVVEDDRGILHIFGPTNLRPAGKARWLAP